MSTLHNIASRRASLTPEQQARLAAQLAAGLRGDAAPVAAGIPALQLARAPLSHAQQRQWFLWQLDPQATTAHMAEVLRLQGVLDAAAVREAFQSLVARHASLRTVFEAGEDGLAQQVIQPEMAIEVPLIDHLGEAPDAACVQATLQRLLLTPYDLARGPLLRVALVRLGPEDHLLVLGMHHIVSDGWSMQLLLREFGQLYAGQGALPALPIAYADYAAWQTRWLADGETARQLAYWRQQLGSEHPVLQLPADHARRAEAAHRLARLEHPLPPALVQGLRRLAQQQGGTLFMALLAGLQALLYRYTGQRDIRIGVPIANRHRAQTEGLVGLFVNTQVLRSQLDGRMRLHRLFAQVREAALGAQAHQDLPFEQLVEALQPERQLGSSPLCQVMFNHLRADGSARPTLPGLTVQPLDLALDKPAQFELSVTAVEDANGGLRLDFGYPQELFERATIARLAEHAEAVLRALAEAPESRLAELPLPHVDEQAWQAAAHNPRRFADAPPLHTLFARQAAATPEAIALRCAGRSLRYAELEAHANRLAHALVARGAGPETLVAIALPRSIEMVVGLLAILKTGAAYLPLDPGLPPERLALMLRDSGAKLLLAAQPAPPGANLPVLMLQDLELTHGPAQVPVAPVHAEQLAYVLYTSGSTGRPKGVMVRHHALSHFLLSMRDEAPGLGPQDVVLALTALSFDIAALELWLPLISGAQLVLADADTLGDGRALAQLVDASGATVVQATPSGWRLLLAAGWPASGQARVKALCGGEALPPDLVASLQALGVSLWNLYGPTETTIWSSAEAVPPGGEPGIGRAIAGTRLHVLDADLQPVPLGAAGELYIGGVGLARGYLQRPGLSAERFIADPFGHDGARLYRTGDLVRASADGRLAYLGRSDHQVKLRGFRIELGEIEAQLLAQPGVRAAVVMARTGPTGLRLVAYIAQGGEPLDDAMLRAALARVLPEYMLPSALVQLAALPLNTNGKVDRHALPEPGAALDAAAHEAPEGDTEQALATLWQNLLGRPRVGRRDHFFSLGGHSLLAVQLVARLQQAGHADLALKDVFRLPVLQDLAAHLDGLRTAAKTQGRDADQALAAMDAFLDSLA
ncbi:MAG TPA: amino acid adenylation domain-containing protein [Ideonella sp.]|uniref:amino acid adenylation domain-containing protein n=1 Tax=Ideonella sp. TaxID=1929293 RepID=UPI002BC24408|nr:amino acid adenylation domain-containing protein [Ideonella sp.]HSI49086.1 amino acid adenylation domain-containing protein [Ideonella sp.]